MHKLEKTIRECKSLKEKQECKCKEFCKIKTPLQYQYEGVDITIMSITKDDKGLLTINPIASKDGVEIKLNTPYKFQNPPVKIKDGTKRKEMMEGKEVELDNFKVDLEGALKEFVGQVVLTQIK